MHNNRSNLKLSFARQQRNGILSVQLKGRMPNWKRKERNETSNKIQLYPFIFSYASSARAAFENELIFLLGVIALQLYTPKKETKTRYPNSVNSNKSGAVLGK